ncbi:MAG: Cadherin-like domain, partial [Actinomycetota bacterium]|nr:Cadherin-like domain [Actinomycetota bacterium]
VVLRSDGSFTYTPDAGYSGFDSFSYLVSDSQPGGTASAEITVGDPPTQGEKLDRDVEWIRSAQRGRPREMNGPARHLSFDERVEIHD